MGLAPANIMICAYAIIGLILIRPRCPEEEACRGGSGGLVQSALEDYSWTVEEQRRKIILRRHPQTPVEARRRCCCHILLVHHHSSSSCSSSSSVFPLHPARRAPLPAGGRCTCPAGLLQGDGKKGKRSCSSGFRV